MRKPVFKLFCLLLFALILEGCGERQGGPSSESQTQGSGRQGVLSYETGDAGVTITDCDGPVEGDLEIPAEIAGLPATSIGKGAFVNCSRLTSITIPDGLTSIENWAFHRCSSLTSVSIPNSVTTIGDFAFANCFGLNSITIPQAFHSEAEASRLKLDKLWPNDFSLPDSSSK